MADLLELLLVRGGASGKVTGAGGELSHLWGWANTVPNQLCNKAMQFAKKIKTRESEALHDCFSRQSHASS